MDGREGGTAEGEWLASQAGRAPAAQHAEVLPLRGEERKVEAASRDEGPGVVLMSGRSVCSLRERLDPSDPEHPAWKLSPLN